MSTSVVVYGIRSHKRSNTVCDAMEHGLKKHGVSAIRRWEDEFNGVEGDIACFYGLEGKLSKAFKEYSSKAKMAYIDLGYWGRKDGGRWAGHHKITINSRHPTDYFQRRVHDGKRMSSFNLKIESWRKTNTGHILLVGMGDKGARAEGYELQQWENWAVTELRKYTKRPILYRPKPSCKKSRPIPGVGYSKESLAQNREKGLLTALENCYATVSHHSNVAVDGIIRGIPAFVWKGVAAPMGCQDLSQIDNPVRLEGKEQWLRDISYCQWSVKEIYDGVAWRDLREDGLV